MLVGRARTALIAHGWSPAKAALLERIASRPVTMPEGQPVVSVTFDDVPASVMANGLPVLEELAIRATFYVALRMAPAAAFLREDDVRLLALGGHHIGCHTLTHYSLRHGSAHGLHADALEGRRALEAVTGRPVTDFSYPYGAVSLSAKRLLGPEFQTMRTSTHGVNRGRVDLAYLRAENLYSGAGLMERIRRRLRSIRRGGWLILYTHGVTDRGTRFDTTRSDFRRAMELVRESGLPVLPVAEAQARLKELSAEAGGGDQAARTTVSR